MPTFFQTFQAFNKPQPDKYDVLINHRLTPFSSVGKKKKKKKKAYPNNWHMFCMVLLKLVFFLAVCVFGSCFRTLAVIPVSVLMLWLSFVLTFHRCGTVRNWILERAGQFLPLLSNTDFQGSCRAFPWGTPVVPPAS